MIESITKQVIALLLVIFLVVIAVPIFTGRNLTDSIDFLENAGYLVFAQGQATNAEVLDEGVTLAEINRINFLGNDIACVDDGGNSRVNCTIDNVLKVDGSEDATGAIVFQAGLSVEDSQLLAIGTDSDTVFVHSIAGLVADTTLANVIVGTPTNPATAANSLVISNITSDGDIIFITNDGGNSQAQMFLDGSLTAVTIYGRGLTVRIVVFLVGL